MCCFNTPFFIHRNQFPEALNFHKALIQMFRFTFHTVKEHNTVIKHHHYPSLADLFCGFSYLSILRGIIAGKITGISLTPLHQRISIIIYHAAKRGKSPPAACSDRTGLETCA